MTTGAMACGPSFASWFLAKKDGEGVSCICCHYPRHRRPSRDQAWISLRLFPEARARRKTVFQVSNFKVASSSGSKGGCDSLCRTNARSHLGKVLDALGLSL